MFRVAKWAMPVLALALLVGLSASRATAEEKAAKGTVTGKVVDKDGNPVAEATTDKDGAFTMPDVPAGDYRVVCRVKDKGTGNEKVTVKAGETATVEIKLGEIQGKKK